MVFRSTIIMVAAIGVSFMTLAFQGTSPLRAVLAVSGANAGDVKLTSAYHPADLDSNWRIALSEAIGYLAGWQQGSNPMAYAVRAAYLWQNGEKYHFDDSLRPPVCWVLGAVLIETDCHDDIDNDGDTFMDCDDWDCHKSPYCNPESICNDDIDNDGDTFVDCSDWDCDSSPFCNPESICNDGIDNDGDTFLDCGDWDCDSSPFCNPESICNDDIDNDGDTYVDCDDWDCDSSPFCY